ncbi:ubiquinol-cytochrome C reductase complex 14kD subunit domain-containing protein [Ditylenchus destructor]|nr:ubiquinol-cytochrome C reductase complex 14kD subunit domain-containing protein [Ditylenchus destructor]
MYLTVAKYAAKFNAIPLAATKNVKQWESNSKFSNWLRWFTWNNLHNFRQWGMHYHDMMFENAPVVKEAVRRLNIREPWVYDQRVARLTYAHILSMNNERLPKERWTQWDEETYYLKPYLDEVEAEQVAYEKAWPPAIDAGATVKIEDK